MKLLQPPKVAAPGRNPACPPLAPALPPARKLEETSMSPHKIKAKRGGMLKSGLRTGAEPKQTRIHFRRKTDFFPEEDTTKSYSGFEPEPTRLQAEGHSHHTGWVTLKLID
ncbi:hypothetical protein TNCV_4239371 [Trichonephila clavipes]|nr:hypothetical protein TNCV_4239371 [Trichonephila clavipes]